MITFCNSLDFGVINIHILYRSQDIWLKLNTVNAIIDIIFISVPKTRYGSLYVKPASNNHS